MLILISHLKPLQPGAPAGNDGASRGERGESSCKSDTEGDRTHRGARPNSAWLTGWEQEQRWLWVQGLLSDAGKDTGAGTCPVLGVCRDAEHGQTALGDGAVREAWATEPAPLGRLKPR